VLIELRNVVAIYLSAIAEIAEQEQASANPAPTGLKPERESEKSEKIMATEKSVEQDFPKRE
jgi:hypothetical protein